jgi:iron complex outermembrane receptor protein
MDTSLLTQCLALWVLFIANCVTSANAANTSESTPVQNIIVLAHPLASDGLSQAVDVLAGSELERKRSVNIGATLAKQPGIHSASFGNSVGRPIIHGLGGARVRIMEDRIDVLDVSTTSADHAVSIEPFIAERIEVFKGASTLLYGSGAIGGVVDIHTGRIPKQLPTDSFSGGLETRFDDNSDAKTTSAKLNGGLGKFAWHLDATSKNANDYEIPGYATSEQLLALASPSSEAVDGTLPGSFYDADSAAFGASYFTAWGFIGASLSAIDSEYGLPGNHEDNSLVVTTPTLELEQTRADFELGVDNPFKHFSQLNMRLGINDYSHQEIEPDGEIATTFDNEAWEFRTELIYESSAWRSVFGLQHTDKQFSALGEEAFIKPVDSEETGIFWLSERPYEFIELEAGIRLGRLEHDPMDNVNRDFSTAAFSVGAVLPISNAFNIGVIADYASRAPVAEELYANGPHLVTNAYESGNVDLDSEKATNISLTFEYSGSRISAKATGYYMQFEDFIYQQATGQTIDTLPEFAYQQDDARFYGVDLAAEMLITKWKNGELMLNSSFDMVNAKLDVAGNRHVPRLPPMRYGAELALRQNNFSAGINFLRVEKQSGVAELELPTNAYNDFGAYMQVDISASQETLLTLFIQGKNLSDEEQRAHTSFIKDFAPAAGRSVESGIRLSF